MRLKKIFSIIFGIILALLILETGLHFSSWIADNFLNKKMLSKDGRLRILCVGDSYTYGLGVARQDTYPAQLEELLRLRLGDNSAEVINLGRPGINTPTLAGCFSEILNDYRPHIVLVLIGTNDEWNFEGFLDTPQTLSERFYRAILSLRISKMFAVFTTAKPKQTNNLIEHMDKKHICNKLKYAEESGGLNKSYYYQALMLGNEYRDNRKFEEAKLYYDCAVRINPHGYLVSREFLRYYNQVLKSSPDSFRNGFWENTKNEFRSYIRLVHFDKEKFGTDSAFAIEMFDLSKVCRLADIFEENLLLLAKTVKLYGLNDEVWGELDELFISWDDPKQAIKFYEYLLSKYPVNFDVNLRLARQYKRVMDYEKVNKYYNTALYIDPENPEAIEGVKKSDILKRYSRNQRYSLPDENNELYTLIDDVFESKNDSADAGYGIETLNETFSKRNETISKCIKEMVIEAQLKNIKLVFLSYPFAVYENIRITVEKEGIGFIDFRDAFTSVITPANFDEYFFPDGHCTKKGYKTMADRISELLLSEF